MDEKNEILEEIWNVRKKIEQENKDDIITIYEHYKSLQAKNPQEYYAGKPVKIRKKTACYARICHP
jgi:hypothetical protein